MKRLASLALVFCFTSLCLTSWAQEKAVLELGVPKLSFDDSDELPVVDEVLIATPAEPGKLEVAPPIVAALTLRPSKHTAQQAPTRGQNVRVDNDVPNMRVVTKGPDTLTVGRKATYVIELTNQSQFDAGSVVVRYALPEWVDLAKQKATHGEVATNLSGSVAWTIESVKAKGVERLKLDVIPQAGKPFDLDVELAVQPRRAKRQITIREAKLKVDLKGPKDFAFESAPNYVVTISNPGTAAAGQVRLVVTSDTHTLAEVPVGTVLPGASRTLDLKLSARLTGTVPLKLEATAEPGLEDEASASVLIRRGEPVVRIDGSAFEFAGTNSNYVVTVKNTGDAVMNAVNVRLDLPNGAKYVRGLEQPQVKQGHVEWTVRKLEPNSEKKFPIVVQLNEQGRHDFAVKATAAADLIAQDSTFTSAEAAADLKLAVVTPKGPQPIGQLVEYEIQIRNVGTAAAQDISVLAVCAPELRPVEATGDPAIKNSQVIFRPVGQIKRGEVVTYKLKIRAREAGSHSFRVAVMSKAPALRFASEDTTRYFDRNARVEEVARRQGETGIN